MISFDEQMACKNDYTITMLTLTWYKCNEVAYKINKELYAYYQINVRLNVGYNILIWYWTQNIDCK